ncbi:hypothetical protein PG995_004618 [Apiospora arundinis]
MIALVGIFTVAGPLSYFLVAMVHHPKWQAAMQQEIDEVCGGRPPLLDDTPRLPILRACIKETMRWKPNVPTGVAHETEAGDMYKGYFIPKGTRILPLDWAFLRNPVKYPDPENFRPERWLQPDELIIACGALMWCFNLKPKVDPLTGQELPVPLDKSNSLLIIKPDPFQMTFEPRSEERKQEALRYWHESKENDLRQRADFTARTAQVLESPKSFQCTRTPSLSHPLLNPRRSP